MKYLKRVVIHLIILTAIVCLDNAMIGYIQQTAKITHLLADKDTKELLRQQQVPMEIYQKVQEFEEKSQFSRYDYLLAHILTEKEKKSDLDHYLEQLYRYYPQKVRDIEKMEAAVWQDLEYFPVPVSSGGRGMDTSFENSWMFDRNFGGNRGHEGTDIMASLNQRGRYPVVSMTDGVVEKIGWLELGGYRIGIRSPSGGYFYYAHLYDYAREFQEGEEIEAGELLGFMGDSGYGQEGMTGQFAVHLHVGIYVNDETGSEISFNPYYVLKSLESKKLTYSY